MAGENHRLDGSIVLADGAIEFAWVDGVDRPDASEELSDVLADPCNHCGRAAAEHWRASMACDERAVLASRSDSTLLTYHGEVFRSLEVSTVDATS